MTRLTAMLIASNDVSVIVCGPGGEARKYGFCITMLDETPSGSKRLRDLLSSAHAYDTEEMAKDAGFRVVCEARELEP